MCTANSVGDLLWQWRFADVWRPCEMQEVAQRLSVGVEAAGEHRVPDLLQVRYIGVARDQVEERRLDQRQTIAPARACALPRSASPAHRRSARRRAGASQAGARGRPRQHQSLAPLPAATGSADSRDGIPAPVSSVASEIRARSRLCAGSRRREPTAPPARLPRGSPRSDPRPRRYRWRATVSAFSRRTQPVTVAIQRGTSAVTHCFPDRRMGSAADR